MDKKRFLFPATWDKDRKSNGRACMIAEEVRKTVIGLSRDLRGIAFAFNTKVSYMMLFDWIYPQYTPILQRAVEIWYNDPQVWTLRTFSIFSKGSFFNRTPYLMSR